MWLCLWLAACRFLVTEDIADLEKDIERACRIAEKIEKESEGDSSKKLTRLVKRVADEHAGPAVLALLQAIEQAPPGLRRKIVDEALKQNGLSGLNCPALDRIVGSG